MDTHQAICQCKGKNPWHSKQIYLLDLGLICILGKKYAFRPLVQAVWSYFQDFFNSQVKKTPFAVWRAKTRTYQKKQTKANQFWTAKFWDIVREMKDLQCNEDGGHNAREDHVDQRREPNRCSNLTLVASGEPILFRFSPCNASFQMIPMFASKISWQKGSQKLTDPIIPIHRKLV